jgi:hypothetical protein
MSAARSGLGATLRFELVSDEGRPLFVSYLVASLLALSWLGLVRTMPIPLADIPPVIELPDIIVVPEAATPASRSDRVAKGRGRASSPNASGIRDLFSGNTGLVDAGKILRGVDVSPTGSRSSDPSGMRATLGTGIGSRTPGRSRSGDFSPSGSGIGAVRGTGVSRSGVTIAPPEVRPVVAGTTVGNATEVGQAARAHVPQLERCYHDEGLTRNAGLAGLVRLALIVEGGRVTSAEIASRSWSGAGVAETESCLVRAVRGWRLGNGDARIVLPLSFTSPATAPR